MLIHRPGHPTARQRATTTHADSPGQAIAEHDPATRGEPTTKHANHSEQAPAEHEPTTKHAEQPATECGSVVVGAEWLGQAAAKG